MGLNQDGAGERDRITTLLEGDWEYRCRVETEEKFDNGELEKGGLAKIFIEATATGWDAQISGRQHWFKNKDGTPQKLEEFVNWKAQGGVKVNAHEEVSFDYFFSETLSGMSRNTYPIINDDTKLSGKFDHVRNDGRQINGKVELRKRNAPDYEQMAPPMLEFNFSL